MRRHVVGLIVTALVAGVVSPASAQPPPWAQTPTDCIDAVDRGQDLRSQRKLIEARARFAQCGSDTCPSAVRRDCLQFLTEIEGSLPTIVFAARTSEGEDVRAVTLTLDDGAPRALDELGGQAIALDPGRHKARFDVTGRAPLTLDFVAAEGEKNRRVIATFTGSEAAPQAPASTAVVVRPGPPVAPRPDEPRRESYLWPVVSGAVSVVTLGGFAYFGLTGRSELSDIRATGCAPHCNEPDVTSAHDKLVVADVLLGVSVVAAAATVWLLLRGSTSRVEPARAASTR